MEWRLRSIMYVLNALKWNIYAIHFEESITLMYISAVENIVHLT